MQTISTSWESGATEHAVVTVKLSTETTAEWLARHRDAVEAAQVIWPPNQ